VFFVVKQISPVCRAIGRFTVLGHPGLNRVRFAGRVNGRELEAGTYRISAGTRLRRLVRRVTVVIVSGGVPSRAQLASARSANVCPALRGIALAAASVTGTSETAGGADVLSSGERSAPSVSAPTKGSNVHSGAVLGSSVEKTARALRPVLVALLALAILLLGLASLPQPAVPGPHLGSLLGRHRMEIVAVGTVALVGGIVALILG
jgi:hypothetical protein